jgi:hypothetical protein
MCDIAVTIATEKMKEIDIRKCVDAIFGPKG